MLIDSISGASDWNHSSYVQIHRCTSYGQERGRSRHAQSQVIQDCHLWLILSFMQWLHLMSWFLLLERSERADAAVKRLKDEFPNAKISSVDCDLMNLDSVRKAAESIKQKFEGGIDVLCNNAGIMADEDKPTKDGCKLLCLVDHTNQWLTQNDGMTGYDTQMQTNHLSHFLLTKELMPLLNKAAANNGEARIVNHTSSARYYPSTPLQAKYYGKNGGNLGGNGNSFIFGGARWQRYHQVLFSCLDLPVSEPACDRTQIGSQAALRCDRLALHIGPG
jgi:hypothetical protein